MNHLIPLATTTAPALVAAVGERASYRFLEFFRTLISTTIKRLKIGPHCPRPTPEALCASLESL